MSKIRYSGYHIYCPKHGYKSAVWMDELVPGARTLSIKKQFEQQHEKITFPNHIDCGGITIIDELRGGSAKDLDEFQDKGKQESLRGKHNNPQ